MRAFQCPNCRVALDHAAMDDWCPECGAEIPRFAKRQKASTSERFRWADYKAFVGWAGAVLLGLVLGLLEWAGSKGLLGKFDTAAAWLGVGAICMLVLLCFLFDIGIDSSDD